MTLINLFKPGLGELFGLSVLSLMGIALAFMVMAMASGFESRALSNLEIAQLASADVVNEPIGQHAMLNR